MQTAQLTVYKFAEILFRPDCEGNTLTCSLFGVSKVLHLCPPCDVTNNLIAFIASLFANRKSSEEQYIAALRCIYLTAKLSNIHKQALV